MKMQLLSSLILLLLGIWLLTIAWPLFLLLFVVVIIAFVYFYFKSRSILKDAQKDIKGQWNHTEQFDSNMNDVEPPKKDQEVIDVEYTERDIK